MKYWYNELGQYVHIGGAYPFCDEHPCCGSETGTGSGTCYTCFYCTDCLPQCVVIRFNGLTCDGSTVEPDFEMEVIRAQTPPDLFDSCLYALTTSDVIAGPTGYPQTESIGGPCGVGSELTAFESVVVIFGDYGGGSIGWAVNAICQSANGVISGGPKFRLPSEGNDYPFHCLPDNPDEELELPEISTPWAWFCGYTADATAKAFIRRGDCSLLPPDVDRPEIPISCIGLQCAACPGYTPMVMSTTIAGLSGTCAGVYNGQTIELQQTANPCVWESSALDIECFPLTLIGVQLTRDTVATYPRVTITYNFIFDNGSISNTQSISFETVDLGTAEIVADCFGEGRAYYESQDMSLGMAFLNGEESEVEFIGVCEAGTG